MSLCVTCCCKMGRSKSRSIDPVVPRRPRNGGRSRLPLSLISSARQASASPRQQRRAITRARSRRTSSSWRDLDRRGAAREIFVDPCAVYPQVPPASDCRRAQSASSDLPVKQFRATLHDPPRLLDSQPVRRCAVAHTRPLSVVSCSCSIAWASRRRTMADGVFPSRLARAST